MLENFYGDVLPQSGYFCLFNKSTKQHIWAESHDELIDLTKRYSDHEGIYFATASYQSVANRKQPNVRALRSLRIDIDVAKASNPDGSYANQKLALAAMIGFFKSEGLPPTYIVSSGKGFHVYWCMDADCAPADWVPMAEGLQRRGAAAGLLIDSTCTIDTARILRPPGTIHHDDVRVSIKHSSGLIWTVADLRGRLVSATTPDIPSAPAGKYDTSINREAIIEVVRRPPVSAIAVAQQCAALRFVADTGGKVPEPYWRAMLGLVKHTIEGEDLAHEWSMGHLNYDEEETQKKIDLWTAGPTTCAEFSNHTKACETCPHRGQYRSPVLLVNPPLPVAEPEPQVTATMASAAVSAPPRPPLSTKPWEGHLPPGYYVDTTPDGKTHSLYTLTKADPPEQDDFGRDKMVKVPFTHNIWWLGQWAGTDHADEKARMTVHLLEHGIVKTYTMEQNILAALPEFKKTLANMSIHPLPGRKESQAMLDYGLNLVRHIHQHGKRLQIADHLGLRILPGGELIATQGAHTIFPDGRIEHSMIAGHLVQVSRQFNVPLPAERPGGEWGPEVWQHIEPLARQHVQFLQTHYGRPGLERLQVAIMMGLASPFMPFVEGKFQSGSTLPRVGLSVSLFSRTSGAGKTTAVAAAIAAYGSPQDLINDGGAAGATEKARGSRLSIHGSLPHVMDEMGSNTPQAVAQAVSMIANGAPRERAGQAGGLNISAPWALMNLMTTNLSQRDMISAVQESSDAIQQRLLEINVDDLPEFDINQRNQFMLDWMGVQQKCIGALGAVIHREICKLGVVGVNNLVLSCVAKADQRLGGTQGSRFQYRGLGAMFALFIVLQKVGIEIFPMKGVLEAFKTAHDAGQLFIAENTLPTDGLELMARMLHDKMGETLVTDNEEPLSRHHENRSANQMLNERMPNVVSVRHVRTTGISYVSKATMKEWCSLHGIGDQEMVKRARKEGVLIPFKQGERFTPTDKYNLHKGMRAEGGGAVHCYKLDCHKLAALLGVQAGDVPGANAAPPPPPSNVVPLR